MLSKVSVTPLALTRMGGCSILHMLKLQEMMIVVASVSRHVVFKYKHTFSKADEAWSILDTSEVRNNFVFQHVVLCYIYRRSSRVFRIVLRIESSRNSKRNTS